MDILLQAVQAVQRNVTALGLYLLFVLPASVLVLAGNAWMGTPEPDAPLTAGMLAYELAGDALLIAAMAFAQSIAFSRMGRQIDWPLWKCRDDREALKRYLPLWVLLNVIALGSQRLTMWIPAVMDNEAAVAPMFWIMSIVMAVYLPFGAAVMFAGRPDWRTVGEALAPLGRQWPKTLSVCFFSGMSFILLTMMVILGPGESQRWALPALDVISGYVDCVVFCATWQVCILDRQAPDDGDVDYF